MDKTILCQIDMFSINQRVVLSDGTAVNCELEELGNFIPDLCYSEGIYTVHLYGNEAFLEPLIDKIKLCETKNYSNKKIKIEVN